MFRSYVIISLFGAYCLCFGSADIALGASKQVNLKPGLWKITTEINMDGVPYAIPSVTRTTCMGEEDLVPTQDMGQPQSECTMEYEILEESTVVWESTCQTEAGQVTSKGKTTYRGTTFEGEMTTKIPNAGMTRQVMTGKRIGPCP